MKRELKFLAKVNVERQIEVMPVSGQHIEKVREKKGRLQNKKNFKEQKIKKLR